MNAGALIVGEALIDEVVEGNSVRRHVGGSPANVALGLSRLNVVTRLHTAIGEDADGQLIPPVKTKVADTVGAGDSFMATLIWALIFESGGWDGRPISMRRLEEVGRKAARAAAITVSRRGADLPVLSDFLTDRITV